MQGLVSDREAVSEVIGVILMVAITVILAAVIATVVLGIGEETEVAPTAQFSFDYDPGSDTVTVTHSSGDQVRADLLYIRGQNLGGSTGNWEAMGGDASEELAGESAVSSGDSVVVGSSVSRDYVLRVVWEAETGDTSAELASNRGPDA